MGDPWIWALSAAALVVGGLVKGALDFYQVTPDTLLP